MTPYINNAPFVTGLGSGNAPKSGDNTVLLIFSGILVIGGAIAIYYCQQKHFNKIIANLKTENDRLKNRENT